MQEYFLHFSLQPVLTTRDKLFHPAPLLLLVVVLCGACADGLQAAEVGKNSYEYAFWCDSQASIHKHM